MSPTGEALSNVIGSQGKRVPSLGEIVNGLLVVQHPMTPASMLKHWLPLLTASERVTVSQVVCADASVRGARVHLHCLRGAFALDLTSRELTMHAESVGRRWLASGVQMRAHVEALVVLLLRSSVPELRARALACLGPSVLGYEIAHEESFTNVLYNLFQFTQLPLDRAHRAALAGLLKALPRRATLYWPDDNWSVAVHILAINSEFESMIELLDIWFDRALPTTRFKEIHFVGILAVLARALRRDLAELVVSQYMIQKGKVDLTSLTYGVMIQVSKTRRRGMHNRFSHQSSSPLAQVYGRCREIEGARRWYADALKLPKRTPVFYIQMIDCESYNGTWKDVKSVCEQMLADVGDGDEPNVYTTVLEAMQRLQQFDDLDWWYERARVRNMLDEKAMSRYEFCLRARQSQQALARNAAAAAGTASANARQE
jgi:hypothetical protein